MTPPALPDAVLWDMDGTIIDSEPYWMAEEHELVASYGGVWTDEDAMLCVGQGLDFSASILRSRGVDMTIDEIIAHMTERVAERVLGKAPWRPGSPELLRELRDAGVRTALVTMSYREMADSVVDALGFDAFDVVVAGDQVEHAKPHPEPYLRAAELLGVDVARCVAIEDSEPGVASAVASGARTIAIPLHVPLPPSPAYTLWESLDGRGLDDLARVFAGEVVA